MNSFQTTALQELTDQQVRFAPPARRLQQLARAEKLLTEIDANKVYPYQYVCFRVTEFRPDSYADLLITGPELENDLCRMIEKLVESMPAVPVEELAEPVVTMDQMSKQLNVSTKTISRWRQRGLVGRRVVCNGRSQVGFVRSVVDHFLKANQERVDKGSRFSQLSEEEKEEILRRARRLSRVSGGTLTEVSRRIARRLNRSPETVRYTIKNYDRDHPDQALFPDVTGPLDADSKQIIYSSYRRGIPVDTLAKRFRRTRTSMYRIINEVRAQRLLDQPLDYIDHPDFHIPAKDAEILSRMPGLDEFEEKKRAMKVPKDVPVELQSLYEMPLLNKEQEQHQFRKMNYLKFKAVQLRETLDPARAKIQELKLIEELQDEAQAVKDLLISCNMRLVVSIAKRHSGQTDNFFELLSDGNMSLLRAVEKFDCFRGNKFSTYASWAIMKNFARSIPEEKHRRERYVTGHEDLFEAAPDNRTDEQELLSTAEQATKRVNRLLEYLDPREQQIVKMRAGLEGGTNPKTLEEIGQELGITKERVRQLNVRIMNKLKAIAKEQHMDL